MITYLNGVLKLISKEGFVSKEGETVSYYKLYIQTEGEDGNMTVAELTSKRDFSEFVDQKITAKIRVGKTQKGWYVSVLDITN